MVYFLLFQALRKKKLIFDKIVFAIGEKKLFKIYVSNFNLTHLTYRILYWMSFKSCVLVRIFKVFIKTFNSFGPH